MVRPFQSSDFVVDDAYGVSDHSGGADSVIRTQVGPVLGGSCIRFTVCASGVCSTDVNGGVCPFRWLARACRYY